MDTTYYRFETRKVKVSGGADLLTIAPAPVSAPAGEVLDFARCRRKLETKAAWNGLARAAAEVKTPIAEPGEDTVYETAAVGSSPKQSAPVSTPAAPRRCPAKRVHRATPVKKLSPTAQLHSALQAIQTSRIGSWLELCASVAMILICVYAGWTFLALV